MKAKQIYVCCNNIDGLREYPDNSIDSIVTDAPYGLGKEPDPIKMLGAWISNGFMEVEGGGFMGKKWDSFVPQPNFWREVIRVLKPGGHVLCFFGTRTYDWGVMAMRIAGFEIRDQIQWIYGSGFPKSQNISKAIDRNAGAEREVIGQYQPPGMDKPWNLQNATDERTVNVFASSRNNLDVTAPTTDDAKEWDGWGTALKPANEPIVLARKPLEKGLTIVQNVLKWGTGAINIDAARIKFASEQDKKSAVFGRGTDIMGGNYVGGTHGDGRTNIPPDDQGRFPANVILDEIAAEALDEQTGILTSGKMKQDIKGGTFNVYGKQYPRSVETHGDSGGASRFFYVAKPSRAERNKGLEDFEKRRGGMISNTSGQHITRRDEGYEPKPVANHHPTYSFNAIPHPDDHSAGW